MKVMVSGGFSIIHIGHIRLIDAATSYGEVVVALNSDSWLKRKHPNLNLPSWNERAEVLHGLKHVIEIIPVDDSDGTVCQALLSLHPSFFANGGDRKESNPKEDEVCRKLKIIQLFDIGGGKIQSSRNLCATR